MLVTQTKPVVLVVDDVAANRELVEAHLRDLGYAVRQARDGLEALEQIAAEEPGLLLLDIEMPPASRASTSSSSSTTCSTSRRSRRGAARFGRRRSPCRAFLHRS